MHEALQQELGKLLDIVVVDDSADDLKWMSHLTRNLPHHYTVHTIQDSEMLESTLRDHSPSVVFVDYQLGDQNGIDLIRQFHHFFPEVAFVLITSLGSEKVMASAIRAGASDFIRKEDITANLMGEVIDRVLQNVFRHSYARVAITVLNEGILTTDDSHCIMRCNPAVEVMLGLNENELIGKPIEHFFGDNDKEIVCTLFSLPDSTWDSQPRLRLKSKTGEETIITMSVNSAVAVHERTFIVVLKRVFSPDQVLTSVDTQLAIIDATPDFIGYCNRDGELLFLNPAAKMLLGIKSQEQFDRITLFELFAPVMRRSFATTIFPSLSKKGRYIGNGLVNGKFRKSIPVSVVMNGLSDEEGNLNTITFILRETQREITSPTL